VIRILEAADIRGVDALGREANGSVVVSPDATVVSVTKRSSVCDIASEAPTIGIVLTSLLSQTVYGSGCFHEQRHGRNQLLLAEGLGKHSSLGERLRQAFPPIAGHK